MGDVLDARVVGVAHQRLHRHNRVHGGDEAAVAHAHRVQPLHDLVLEDGDAATLHQEQGEQGVAGCLHRDGIVHLVES